MMIVPLEDALVNIIS